MYKYLKLFLYIILGGTASLSVALIAFLSTYTDKSTIKTFYFSLGIGFFSWIGIVFYGYREVSGKTLSLQNIKIPKIIISFFSRVHYWTKKLYTPIYLLVSSLAFYAIFLSITPLVMTYLFDEWPLLFQLIFLVFEFLWLFTKIIILWSVGPIIVYIIFLLRNHFQNDNEHVLLKWNAGIASFTIFISLLYLYKYFEINSLDFLSQAELIYVGLIYLIFSYLFSKLFIYVFEKSKTTAISLLSYIFLGFIIGIREIAVVHKYWVYYR